MATLSRFSKTVKSVLSMFFLPGSNAQIKPKEFSKNHSNSPNYQGHDYESYPLEDLNTERSQVLQSQDGDEVEYSFIGEHGRNDSDYSLVGEHGRDESHYSVIDAPTPQQDRKESSYSFITVRPPKSVENSVSEESKKEKLSGKESPYNFIDVPNLQDSLENSKVLQDQDYQSIDDYRESVENSVSEESKEEKPSGKETPYNFIDTPNLQDSSENSKALQDQDYQSIDDYRESVENSVSEESKEEKLDLGYDETDYSIVNKKGKVQKKQTKESPYSSIDKVSDQQSSEVLQTKEEGEIIYETPKTRSENQERREQSNSMYANISDYRLSRLSKDVDYDISKNEDSPPPVPAPRVKDESNPPPVPAPRRSTKIENLFEKRYAKKKKDSEELDSKSADALSKEQRVEGITEDDKQMLESIESALQDKTNLSDVAGATKNQKSLGEFFDKYNFLIAFKKKAINNGSKVYRISEHNNKEITVKEEIKNMEKVSFQNGENLENLITASKGLNLSTEKGKGASLFGKKESDYTDSILSEKNDQKSLVKEIEEEYKNNKKEQKRAEKEQKRAEKEQKGTGPEKGEEPCATFAEMHGKFNPENLRKGDQNTLESIRDKHKQVVREISQIYPNIGSGNVEEVGSNQLNNQGRKER